MTLEVIRPQDILPADDDDFPRYAAYLVDDPQGYRYQGRHHHPRPAHARSHAAVARLATGLMKTTFILGFAAVAAISWWV